MIYIVIKLMSYLYNLFHNIYIIIKYISIEIIYFVITHRYKPFENYLCWYAMCKAMIQILKYNAKIIDYDIYIKKKNKANKGEKNYKKQTDIDLLVSYKGQIYCIEVKHISSNINDINYNIIEQLNKQRKIINISNMNYILYICGSKLENDINNLIIDKNPNTYIMYNNLYLPNINISNTKNIILCQSACGYIVSYYNSNYMYDQIISKLMNYTVYTTKHIYNDFNKRMEDSNIEIERNRWNRFKNKIILIDNDNDNDNDKYLFDILYNFKKKYKYLIKFGIENNCRFLSIDNDILCSNIEPYFIDLIKIKYIGIYGSGADNTYKAKNIFKRYFIKLIYRLYFAYILFMKL